MRVGIIGAGQLGRMLALAGYPLGIHSVFLGQDRRSPGGLVGEILVGELDDADRLDALAERCDVVTFEFENVPLEALARVTAVTPVYPPPAALAAAQDRLEEKRLFENLGIPAAPYVAIGGRDDLFRAECELGWPVVLKSRRLGYDGRSQRVVASGEALESAWEELGRAPAIAESRIDFERELSLIGAGDGRGNTVFYPLSENVHQNGILHTTRAPYDDPALQREAQACLSAIMDRLDYRGILTVEFFHSGNGLIANEIAPRVHNSGHWTIEGAETSQFENHMRAVLGLPLGDPSPRGHAAMLNFVGRMPDPARVLGVPGAHLHDYCKKPRRNRKLGHCTLVAPERSSVSERLTRLRNITD